ncbi:MAG: DUF2332 domain-containing protein [Microcella sp.]|uniref:DUF2332 domain-containing protein n=1 Tax=Microcella sp. TaxID=1913979 RepID=UPI003314F6CA
MSTTAERFRRFAQEAAPRSPVYAAWAQALADDEASLALIDELPVASRQPVLVLTAARFAGLLPHESVVPWLRENGAAVARIARERTTQTNDPRRTGPLVAALQGIPGPVALLEVGASAGLTLLPDRYSHVFERAGELHRLDPEDGPAELELRCALGQGVPVPSHLPRIVWRAGLDRQPLRWGDVEAERWLRTLVWPEERDRARQLDQAMAIAHREPPRLVAGDALDGLPALAAQAPGDATLVVWSPAVLVYLDPGRRERFHDLVTAMPGHWISLDGRRVLERIGRSADALLPGSENDFILSVDGRAAAIVSPHGQRIDRWAGGVRPQDSGA